jgi:hypothetical protein
MPSRASILRGMRACATANAVCIGLALVAGVFIACSSSPTSETPPAGTEAPVATAAEPTPPADPTAAAPTSGGADKGKNASTVADCKQLLSEITNEPDGGVVMNNATTAGDAGASDRFAPMVELMRQKRDGFRCCFDIWAKKNAGTAGRVTFVFELGPDGKLKKASAKPDETTIKAPEVESCMVELAGTLTYPKSPSAKDTTYTHRFDFKARN